MNRFIAIPLAAVLAGCVTASHEGNPVIRDFAAIDQNIGNHVVVRGRISLSHEATGLYFSWRDLLGANDRCIIPEPFGDFAHGELVTLSGRLERTRCGIDLICLNTCSDYVLVRDMPFESR